MELIKSFTVNHDLLKRGIYLSRTDQNTKTYDLRVKLPNQGDYLTCEQAHTLEHLCAMWLRNSEYQNDIVYFGPMGCMTGFYLVVFDSLPDQDVIQAAKGAFAFAASFTGPDVPGAKQKECGNYRAHDLAGAIRVAKEYLSVIQDYTPQGLCYPE